MTAKQYKRVIEKRLKENNTYLPAFDNTIIILSEMLEERERVYVEYINTGARPVIEFTSDRGAVNLKPNPLLKQWQEINAGALLYLRELGLTAAGLKKLQGGQIITEKPRKTCEDIMREIRKNKAI